MKRLNSAEVVLIEPNRADAVLFERLLNELGLSPSVRTFGLALNAIAALKSSRPPDLIVTESVLPMLELPEVIDELRSLRGCEQVPIVAFKGLGMPRRLQHPGIAFYLQKPLDACQLGVMARAVFSRRVGANQDV
jgi:CheY-like chemotaxis protein